jgi:hypothetical protein
VVLVAFTSNEKLSKHGWGNVVYILPQILIS